MPWEESTPFRAGTDAAALLEHHAPHEERRHDPRHRICRCAAERVVDYPDPDGDRT
jgi:hypothetical protein